ncbi:hypothetical protein D3C83_218100 [compost metagenome]
MADQLDELVRAEVAVLSQEDVDDEVALAGSAAAGRAQLLDELFRGGNRQEYITR